jgi:hypothetical protein
MITLDLTREQKADIAQQHLNNLIEERAQWFKGVRLEDTTDPESIEMVYEISLLRQALEYTK